MENLIWIQPKFKIQSKLVESKQKFIVYKKNC